VRWWCNEWREEEDERISYAHIERERERENTRAHIERESGLYLLKNSRDGESKKPRQRRISSPKEREKQKQRNLPKRVSCRSSSASRMAEEQALLWVFGAFCVCFFMSCENFCVFQRKDFFYSSLTTNNERFNTHAKNTVAFASSVQCFALHRLFVNVFVRALLANR